MKHVWCDDEGHDIAIHCHCSGVGHGHTLTAERANRLETALQDVVDCYEGPSRAQVEREQGGTMHFAKTAHWLEFIEAIDRARALVADAWGGTE